MEVQGKQAILTTYIHQMKSPFTNLLETLQPLATNSPQEVDIGPMETVIETTNLMQAAKCGATEARREEILTIRPLLPDETVTDWVAVNKLVKAKKAAVSNILFPQKPKAATATKCGAIIPTIKKKTMGRQRQTK
jgi:hypothetical protein